MAGWAAPPVVPSGPLEPVLAPAAALWLAANLAYAGSLALACRGRAGAAVLLAPLHWLMEGLAAWRGLVQPVARPQHWETTEHGLAAPARVAHRRPAE